MNVVQPIRDLNVIAAIKQHLREKNQRDYFLFIMGINIGLRINDMLSFKVRDVKGKSGITLREMKTGKQKTIPINSTLRRAINEYIDGKPDDEFLFLSRQKDKHGLSKAITREMAYRILRRAAAQFNLVEIGCHTMRKTFGYHFYKKEKDIALLMDIFNHSEESITLRYIGINQDAINTAMSRFGL